MASVTAGLLDTSVFIASENGRAIRTGDLPAESSVSVVTIGELQAGVLAARDTATGARRLATLQAVSGIEPLNIDAAAARHWARLRVRLAEEGLARQRRRPLDRCGCRCERSSRGESGR